MILSPFAQLSGETVTAALEWQRSYCIYTNDGRRQNVLAAHVVTTRIIDVYCLIKYWHQQSSKKQRHFHDQPVFRVSVLVEHKHTCAAAALAISLSMQEARCLWAAKLRFGTINHWNEIKRRI